MRALILLMVLGTWAVGCDRPAAAIPGPMEATTELGCPTQAMSERVASAELPWRGPDGVALPFRDDPEILEFLRTAAIVSARPVSKGINKSLKVLLEKDGVRAHAIFRSASVREPNYRPPGSRYASSFRDSCFFEPAAYELGRLLGIRQIPPVVERRYDGRRGTLQIWVENAFDEQARLARGLRSPHPDRWRRQRNVRQIFDALIHNIDRNQGNLLIDPEWNLWLIDHTRAFVPEPDLADRKRIEQCDRDLWERLRTIDRQAAAKELEPYLTGRELKTLLIRWEKLVKHIRSLIDREGEGAVLF